MATGDFLQVNILIHIICHCLTQETLNFQQIPEAKQAMVGKDITFHCIVNNLQADRHMVQWNRGGQIITNNTQVISKDTNKIQVIADPGIGQYDLQISHIVPSDDLSYSCIVWDVITGNTVLTSDAVRLEVQNIPSTEYPRCNPLAKMEFQEGEAITITCTSERANPPVRLQWYQGGQLVLDTKLDDSLNGFRSLRHTFHPGYRDDNAIFQCKMTTIASESFERSCSLGPLNIVYKPRVSLVGPEQSVEDGQEIELECDANAKPEPFRYMWISTIPLEDQYFYMQNQRVMMLTASLRFNGTRLSCNATNIHGNEMSHNTLTLLVRSKTTTTANTVTGKQDTNNPDNDEEKPAEPDTVASPQSDGLSSKLLLLIIGILSVMLIILLVVLIFYTCRIYQPNSNNSVVYGAPSSICNGTNIDRAWDQTSVYFEPRDQISVTEAPTFLRTPKQPQWRRNVAVQVPFQEDPAYAEIEQDWDDGVYTLQI